MSPHVRCPRGLRPEVTLKGVYMSQNDKILAHLERKPITPVQALSLYGCFRLAARIKDLREQGNTIITHIVSRNGKRFAMYALIGGAQ
jgi:hypothetical protein